MLTKLFTIIAPVFVCAAIGFVWKRRGHPFDADFIINLTTVIGMPCLVFATLVKVEMDWNAFRDMAGASVVTFVAFGAVSWAALKVWGLEHRAFWPGQVFANFGNMGLPLCLLAFGQQGLALAIVYFTIGLVLLFTAGYAVAAGTASIQRLVRMPLIYFVAAALLFVVTETEPPQWIYATTKLIGDLTIPLMLIALGVSVASLKVKSIWRSLGLSLLRLGTGFAVGVVTALAFGLEGPARGVLILESAMPVAVFAYLFAARYDTQPGEVAGTVVVSTAVSFVTLPTLLWFVL
jgi:predicted permease